jgi:hypothetical protein
MEKLPRFGILRIAFHYACIGLPAIGLALTTEADEPKKPAPSHRIVRVTDPDAPNPVEVSVAIDPSNPDRVIAAAQQLGRKGQPAFVNFVCVSTDFGNTWKTVPRANPDHRVQGDDCITFSADGLAVHGYIAFNGIRNPRPPRASSGIFVCTSKDGLTWGEPVPVVDHINTTMPFEDKPWLRVDASKDSPHKGNIYVGWTRFDQYGSKDPAHKSHIYFSRSRDRGKTFSVGHRISDNPGDCLDKSDTLMGCAIAVGPKGEVYAVWGGPKGLSFNHSTDGGFNFGREKVVTDTPGGWDFGVKGIGRCNGLPMMGVDVSSGPARGTIHITWVDRRNGDPDVFVTRSTDHGETWSKPLRVNDDAKGNGKEQFFAAVAVDPVDGSVNVAFFDRRNSDDTTTAVTLARSIDGGRTFVNHRINQEPFACSKGAFFGDYLGIDAHSGRVVVAYQHFNKGNRLAISAALFRFKEGTQEVTR